MTTSNGTVVDLANRTRRPIQLARVAPTRVIAPRPSCRVVERVRLLELLTEAVSDAPLTLVCAPAGSGKTVLAAEWAARGCAPGPVAWLTVDESDDSPAVFWAHVQQALSSGLGGSLRPLPSVPGVINSAFIETMAESLPTEGRPVTLVIDEAHRLSGSVVSRDLPLLLRTAGSRLRLVMATRTEPAMALHRYRLEGTIAEIRYEDLTFTPAEIGSMLVAHGIDSSPSVVAAIETHTEGWAAGVRLATVALQRLPESLSADQHLQGSLGGGHTVLAEFLDAEVLHQLSRRDRESLICLSVVGEISADLARLLTGRADGECLLEELAHRNLFVRRVPGSTPRYRVHPLLREVLLSRLVSKPSGDVEELHRRAAVGCAAAGEAPEAIYHAVLAGDGGLAASIAVDSGWVTELLLPTVQGGAAAEILTETPDRVGSAVVGALRAGVYVGRGDLIRARREITDADAHRDSAPDAPLTLLLATVRTRLDSVTGDLDGTLAAASRARAALRHPSVSDETRRVLSPMLQEAEGVAHFRAGDLSRARAGLSEALDGCADGGLEALRLECLAHLALVEAALGHLTRAGDLARAADQQGAARGVPDSERPAAAGLAVAWAAVERQDLGEARDCLASAMRIDGIAEDPVLGSILSLLRVRFRRDGGDRVAARELLETHSEAPPWLRALLAIEACALGRELGPRAGLPEDHEPPLAKASTGRGVEELLRCAQIHLASGDLVAGRGAVLQALTLARNELLRRPFRHAGPRVKALLRSDPSLARAADWLRPEHVQAGSGPAPAPVSAAVVVEELTAREMEVLQYMADLLDTREIAATMFISINTVRTHARNILSKLSVTRRNAAVRKARQLGIL